MANQPSNTKNWDNKKSQKPSDISSDKKSNSSGKGSSRDQSDMDSSSRPQKSDKRNS